MRIPLNHVATVNDRAYQADHVLPACLGRVTLLPPRSPPSIKLLTIDYFEYAGRAPNVHRVRSPSLL